MVLARPTKVSLLLFPLLAATISIGCSAGGDDGGNNNNNTGASGSGGAGGGTGGGSGGDFSIGGGQGGGTIEECASTSTAAQLKELDIAILLDRSGSMSGTQWTGSVAALSNFVQSPNSIGVNAGITFFPFEAAPSQDACNSDWYDELTVDIGPIGQNESNTQMIVDSMNSESPNGGNTPTYGALEGVLTHATAYQDLNPDHKVIVVFASDGEPNSCPNNQDTIPVIAALASSALNYNGVETYVVAISGSNVANLNQIAVAGGTTAAFDVTADISLFEQKMEEIRAAALACEFVIPDPPDGEELDAGLVNVEYTPSDGSGAVTIPGVAGVADCGAGLGWYYDNPQNPTQILLCPGACNLIQADGEADVQVQFGCATKAD